MKVKVLYYLPPPFDCHQCEELEGDFRTIRIDLLVAGTLPEGTTAEDLVGKIVEYEWDSPYISIAHSVSIIE